MARVEKKWGCCLFNLTTCIMSNIVAILNTKLRSHLFSKINENIRTSKIFFVYYLRFLDIFEDVELLTKLSILASFLAILATFWHFKCINCDLMEVWDICLLIYASVIELAVVLWDLIMTLR